MKILGVPKKSLWPLKDKCDLGPCFFLFAVFALNLCILVGNEFLASEGWALHDGEKAVGDARTGNLLLYTMCSNRFRVVFCLFIMFRVSHCSYLQTCTFSS